MGRIQTEGEQQSLKLSLFLLIQYPSLIPGIHPHPLHPRCCILTASGIQCCQELPVIVARIQNLKWQSFSSNHDTDPHKKRELKSLTL